MREVVVGGLIGVLAALLSQVVAARIDRKRLAMEIELRREELWAGMMNSTVVRRNEALEALHDLLQEVLDTGQVSMREYEQLRPALIYAPRDVAPATIGILKRIVAASRRGDELSEESKSEVRRVQGEIRSALGIGRVEEMIYPSERGFNDS